jgi:hypothetical protein
MLCLRVPLDAGDRLLLSCGKDLRAHPCGRLLCNRQSIFKVKML